MSASNTDLVRNAAPTFATTLANSMLISDTSLTLQSATGLPTATAITLVIDATDPSSGAATPTLKEVVTGTLSGTTVSNLLRGQDGTTQQAHASGANVVMWFTANLWNDYQTSYLTEHTQLGSHVMTSPKITTGINDANGNKIVGLTATGSAVNQLNVADAIAGSPPVLRATGTDSNVDLSLLGKGTGTVSLPSPFKGLLRERQGGTTGDASWQTTGTSNTDTSSKAVFMQTGSVACTTGANTVTFPIAFTQVPVVFAQVTTAGSANVYTIVKSITTTSCNIYQITSAGSGSTTESANWIAIGQ